MNLRTLLAPLAALVLLAAAVPARAQPAHSGHDPMRKCTWQADSAPAFVPTGAPIYDTGSTTRTSEIFGTVVGRTTWRIVVLPGYHFGFVYAWDEGVPLSSQCEKAYSRSSLYGVYKVTDCCLPERSVKPLMACSFRVRAVQLNDPGAASASGMTHIHATNTGLSCVATAATTTRSDDAGTPVAVQVPLPNGMVARINFNFDFDGEEASTDAASNLVVGAAKASPDEEYSIVADLDLEASADGAPWDTGEAAADLTEHTLYIRTDVECHHCSEKRRFELLLDDTVCGVQEKSPAGQ